jgi:hypothetical protein
MSTSIYQVANGITSIKTCELVELTILSTSTYAPTAPDPIFLTSSYKTETWTMPAPDGRTLSFLPVGGFLAVGEQHRDLQISSFDTTLTLDGFAAANIATVLNHDLRGSVVKIWRGFYNNTGTLTAVYKRFSGIVASYVITEGSDPANKTYAIVVNAASYKTIMANNIGGRRTNVDDWARFSPGDTSMSKVAALNGAYFNFGVKV